jgi:hypothetical protein
MRDRPGRSIIFGMNVSNESTASRQFVASAEAFSSTWIKGAKVWQVAYTVFFVAFVGFIVLAMVGPKFGIHVKVPHNGGVIFLGVLAGMTVVVAIGAVYVYWRSRQKIVVAVSGDALTVGSRGEVYSLAEAQLGLWPGTGVALHLRSGGRRFILGGEERRIGPATPLDAPPTPLVDARLPASDFDELLRLGGRSAARGPAPGEPTRCVLFGNSASIENMGPFAFRKKQRLTGSLDKEQLLVDVDNDSIRVIAPDSHAVNASATFSGSTATPFSYERPRDDSGHTSTAPAMSLRIPGLQPLTLTCHHLSGARFSWPANVHITSDPPTYTVSAADWLTLVEKFGLATSLQDTATD